MSFWRFKTLTDWQAVLALVSLCAALKVGVLIQHPILARDGIYYIRFAQELMQPDWSTALRQEPYHPGYPVAIAGIAQVYQLFHSGELTPSDWQRCAHLAASIAGVLLIVPFFGLIRCFFSTKLAFLSCVLFAILPATVQVTTDALAESWLLLFLFTGLWCLVLAVRTQSGFWFASAGLFAGIGYLVRLEALIVPAVGLMVLATRRWWDAGKMSWQCALRSSMLLSACFLLTIAPYALTIGKLSPRPSWGQVLQACDLGNHAIPLTGPNHLLASRMQDGVNGLRIEALRLCDALKLLCISMGKAGHYFLWPLVAVGLLVLWHCRTYNLASSRSRQHGDDPSHAHASVTMPHRPGDLGIGVLWCVVIVDALSLLRLGYSAGYLSERHALLLVALACMPASLGPRYLGARFSSSGSKCWVTGGSILCCLLLCLPKALQPLHGGQEGHRQAGYYLATELTDNDDLIDPYHWASFYAGREVAGVYRPELAKSGKGRTFVIIDPHDADLHRREKWKKAGVLRDDASVVFAWPCGEHPKVLIKQSIGNQSR